MKENQRQCVLPLAKAHAADVLSIALAAARPPGAGR